MKYIYEYKIKLLNPPGPLIWSSDLQINNSVSAISSKTPFEITSETVYGKRSKYLLAFKVSSWPGAFYRTEAVTVISRYCIVNCTDEALDICQDEQYSSPVSLFFSTFVSKYFYFLFFLLFNSSPTYIN